MSKTASAPGAGRNRLSRPPDLNSLPQIEGVPLSFDNGTTQKRLVCLTFDGNDLANAALDILDTLKSRNVKATMFLTGTFILKHPDMVGRIVAGEHEVGSHTFSHPHLTSYAQNHTQTTLPSVTEEFLCRELGKTDSLFRSLTGKPLAPLWRAPYGEFNPVICLWAQRAGFIQIGWRQGRTWKLGLDSNDWTADDETPGYHTPREVYDKIVGLAHEAGPGISGGIILMHLGTVRKQKDAQVHLIVGRLIDTLQSLGYRFVTVTEMLKESGVDIGRLKRG
jgi:peptidoglycan-N-acetylmuramic acid deacetylase